MTEKEKMVCPTCGVEMNCHAEKIYDPTEVGEPETSDSSLGVVIEEFHTCPECGQTHTRRAG